MLDCIVQGKGIVNLSSIDPQLSLMFSEVLIHYTTFAVCTLLHMRIEFVIKHLCIYGIDITITLHIIIIIIIMVGTNCV